MASKPLPQSPKATIIAISGPSSSGKTTLSRFLRSFLPQSFILHEDDFFLPEAQLPRKGEHLDWDSPASLDVPRLSSALAHIRAHGELPSWLHSHEDQNIVGPSIVSPEVLEEQRQRLLNVGINSANIKSSENKDKVQQKVVCILDGFLLYPPEIIGHIDEFLDSKLFFPVSYAKMKERREARKGYVTAEGFWEDPPGYVDDIVWPNYVREHRFLFEGGNVEGAVDHKVVDKLEIKVWDGWKRGSLEEALIWTVGIMCKALNTDQGKG